MLTGQEASTTFSQIEEDRFMSVSVGISAWQTKRAAVGCSCPPSVPSPVPNPMALKVGVPDKIQDTHFNLNLGK
jgi:hypothetical protein